MVAPAMAVKSTISHSYILVAKHYEGASKAVFQISKNEPRWRLQMWFT